MDFNTLNTIILFSLTALGAISSALWLGLSMWTWNDMRARSRDPLAQIAATLVVFLLPIVGILVYLLLRPRETLADAYERSLEEEALLQEIEEKPVCHNCGRPSKSDWQLCPYCHTRLKKPCLQCGYLLELPWNLCPVCATPQMAYEEQLNPRQSQTGGRASASRRSPYDSPGDVAFVED